jgi:hypothetical protein
MEDTEEKKDSIFNINITSIIELNDMRTTLMIRNIPNKYTQEILVELLDIDHAQEYDLFYLPLDYKVKLLN